MKLVQDSFQCKPSDMLATLVFNAHDVLNTGCSCHHEKTSFDVAVFMALLTVIYMLARRRK